MKKILLGAVFFANAAIAQKSDNATKFATYVSEKGLREKLTILASDEMEGRETATEGQKKAAAYIEAQFKKNGLKPGNGNSFQQMYNVYQDELLSHQLIVNGEAFLIDKDYSFSLNAINNTNLNFNDVVFVGYGLNSDKQNDYKNLDVKGKIVIVLDGLPSDAQPNTTQPGTRVIGPGTSASKAITAKNNGAIGLIVISNDFPKKTPLASKGNMTMNKPTDNKFFTISVSEKLGASLLGRTFVPTKKQFEEINRGNYFAETKLNLQKNTANLESSNVIGVVEGTDKKDEYIFITGHYDHLGKRGDVIYYGADDDGSGTTAVIQLAEAFAKAKAKGFGPRRSIVFMAVSGEEKGLWGSKFYADNPTFPLAKTSVDLNIDMIGRIDPSYKGDSMNYVFAIGEDKLSTELQPITDSVNKWYINMEIDRRYNDPKDPNRFYFRSDHYNFAAKGVPIIFYFNGVHKDYHKATDTVDKINFDLMHKRSLLVYYTAWEMANKNDMLKRDLPLSAVPSR
jgi:Zn-dependent M28 family amino/carboxypeptidase